MIKIILSIFLITLLFYLVVASRLTFNFPTEPANYFSHQAYSFLQGRLDLINPSWDHDLSIYQNKLYMYWGPSPVLFILPIIFIFGVNISDIFYTAIFATLSPVFLYLILEKLEKLNFFKLSTIKKILLVFFLAFGTVYFSTATRGGVWFTSQIFSTIYILFSLYLILSFLTDKKLLFLIISSVFLGLGGWARMSFILYLPIFISLLFLDGFKLNQLKNKFNKLIYFLIPLIMIFFLSCLYNFLRFNSFLENGYSYHKEAARYEEVKRKFGILNLEYISNNFFYNFLNVPAMKEKLPFFNFDPEGNSFIVLSPLFLLTPLIYRKKYWQTKSQKILNSSTILCIFLLIFTLLSFWGTGWFQFSARYMLDVIPLLLIILAQVLEDTPLVVITPLFIISVIINTLGAIWLTGVFNNG